MNTLFTYKREKRINTLLSKDRICITNEGVIHTREPGRKSHWQTKTLRL